MTAPWLSVIVPTHDGERWLAETLDSVASERDRGIECIIVDSSPGDGTRRLIARFMDRLSITLHVRPDLDNWRLKTNFGFAVAGAEHVSMLHQDDHWLPGRAAHARLWLQRWPQAAMHLHASRYIDAAGRRIGSLTCPLPAGRLLAGETVTERLLVQNFIAVPTPIIRREAFVTVGGIDEPLWYTGDWDLYLKLCTAGPVVYHRDELACFRLHGQSMTISGSRDRDAFRRQLETVLDRHADRVPKIRRTATLSRARASALLNVAMASAHHGKGSGIAAALRALAGLGPVEIARLLRDARLFERVMPRLRLRAARGL